MSAAAIAVVNSAIAFYEGTFSDPITVNIAFNNMTTGLGSSTAISINYNTFSAALHADATSADDATANVVAAANNPVTDVPSIFVKSANLRAIGINQVAEQSYGGGVTGAFDGCIELNLGLTNAGAYSTPRSGRA